MLNNHWIASYHKVRMFHISAIDEDMLKKLNHTWNELISYEMGLVREDPELSKVVAQHTGVINYDVTSDKFIAYLKDLEWVYIIERIGSPGAAAFMAVTGDKQIASLFVRRNYRGAGLGTYLIFNHLEVFGGSVSLQCFKLNHGALRFYQARGFKFGYECKKEIPTDLYHTLVLSR